MALTRALVDAAIEALLAGGQSYTRAGFTFSRADLGRLIDLRKTLKSEEQRAGEAGASFIDDYSSGELSEASEWGD